MSPLPMSFIGVKLPADLAVWLKNQGNVSRVVREACERYKQAAEANPDPAVESVTPGHIQNCQCVGCREKVTGE